MAIQKVSMKVQAAWWTPVIEIVIAPLLHPVGDQSSRYIRFGCDAAGGYKLSDLSRPVNVSRQNQQSPPVEHGVMPASSEASAEIGAAKVTIDESNQLAVSGRRPDCRFFLTTALHQHGSPRRGPPTRLPVPGSERNNNCPKTTCRRQRIQLRWGCFI